MGFITPDLPPVDLQTFPGVPVLQRVKILATHWCEHGFGGPKALFVLYLFKIAFYVGGGVLVIGLTTPEVGGLSGLGDAWWSEPIVYQKAMVYTVLFEILGFGSSAGPLAFRFLPPIGGVLYYLRPKTLRLPPYANRVPLTAGDDRTFFDVGLYLALLVNLGVILSSEGARLDIAPTGTVGLLRPAPLVSFAVLLFVMGLRDKVVVLNARFEQYLPTMVFFALMTSFGDIVVGAKLAMVVVWMGASISKFGLHFSNVVSVMLSNTPWMVSKSLKRKLYRDFPNDLRPSKFTGMLAHGGGTVVEMLLPLILLFSTNRSVTVVAVLAIVFFHVFIVSTFPLAVPLEWNVFFMFGAAFLFLQYPAQDGYGFTDMSSPAILLVVLFVLLVGPVVGNLKPEWVSFLPSMRQYAGNWACSTWAFRGLEAEAKLNERIVKSSKNQVDQLGPLFDEESSFILMDKAVAFRAMHSQGRALMSLLLRHTDDLDNYVLREGEMVCNVLVGWNFGDGHMHDERLIAAVQKRCNYEPGELVVTWTESQPIHAKTSAYRVIDAALGVVERGTYVVSDATNEQPWLPNGPIAHEVEWTLPGYVAPEGQSRTPMA